MRIISQTKHSWAIRGDFADVTTLIARIIETGVEFDYDVQGWTADTATTAGHIVSRCTATISAEDDVAAVTIKLMLP